MCEAKEQESCRPVDVFAPSLERARTDARLINAVRAHRVLYDVEHARYADNYFKVDVWKEIGLQLRASPNACKMRWNNIRDNYRKSLRRGRRARNSYKYASQMAFMKEFLKNKDKLEDNHTHDETDEEYEEDIKDDEDKSSEKEQAITVPVKLDNSDIEQPEYLEYVDYELFDKPGPSAGSVSRHPEQIHAVDAFLAGLAPTLKAMSRYHLSLAKAEIFATVHKYEMKGILEEGGALNVNPLP